MNPTCRSLKVIETKSNTDTQLLHSHHIIDHMLQCLCKLSMYSKVYNFTKKGKHSNGFKFTVQTNKYN